MKVSSPTRISINQIEVSELRTRLATELRTARYPPLLLRVGPAFAATSNGRRAIMIKTLSREHQLRPRSAK